MFIRGISLVWISSILSLSSRPGRPIIIILSKRPGRSNAGSIMSGRLVAPMTVTLGSSSTPSIARSSWFTTLSHVASPDPL